MDARGELQTMIEHGELTMRAVGRSINVSTTTVSLWLRGEYPGDNAKVEKKVKTFIARRKRRRRGPREIAFRWTTAARRITETLDVAHQEQAFAVVLGPSGIGKTTALKYYCSKHDSAILVEADPTQSERKGFLQAILDVLGGPTKGTARALMKDILDRLSGRDVLLIIDEAEHLSIKSLDCARIIAERSGAALVLSGLEEILMPKLRDDRLAQRILNRISLACLLSKIEAKDLQQIVEQMDLPEIVQAAIIAASLGCPRRAALLARRVKRLQLINPEAAVDESMVKDATQLLLV